MPIYSSVLGSPRNVAGTASLCSLRCPSVTTCTASTYPTSLGYILMLLLISGLREFLGAGALMGTQVMKNALFPMAQLPSGGFILLALVMCVWRAAAASVKQQMSLGAEHL